MMTNNPALYGTKILAEISRDILYFPLWWYSCGFFYFAKKLAVFLSNRQKSLALIVWLKNIHRPMYGQYDWQGKLISLFMRVVQVIFRGVAMLFWVAVAAFFLCIWLVLPLFVVYQIIFQIA